jgi:hypothetical protein
MTEETEVDDFVPAEIESAETPAEETQPEVLASSFQVALTEKPKKKKAEKAAPEPAKEGMSELESLKLQIELEKARLELAQLKAKTESISSREHDPEEQELVAKQIARRNENKTVAAKIRSQKEYDNVKVTGKFLNRRAPGNPVRLTYIKYDDDPVKWWDFMDGRVYTIPRGFVDQINEHYHSPVFVQKTGPIDDPENPGSQIAEVDRSNKKYAFVPINFHGDLERIA